MARLLARGSNVFGALGTGDWTRRAALSEVAPCMMARGAVAAGWGHTAWIDAEGRVRIAGEISRARYITMVGLLERTSPLLAAVGGRLGRGAEASAFAVDVPLPAGSAPAVEVAASSCFTLVRTADGAVYAFGANEAGQCGAGASYEPHLWPPRRVQNIDIANRAVAQLAAGLKHGAAVTESGELLVWGANSSGQLGTGSNASRSAAHVHDSFARGTVQRVAAGVAHTALITKDGGAYVWGKDMSDGEHLDARNRVVDQLEPRALSLGVDARGAALRAVDVSCTAFGAAFLTEDGAVHILGRGRAKPKDAATWRQWIGDFFPRDEKEKLAELEASHANADPGRVVRGANRVTVAPWTAPRADGGVEGSAEDMSLRGGLDAFYRLHDGTALQYELGEAPVVVEGTEEMAVIDVADGLLHTVVVAAAPAAAE